MPERRLAAIMFTDIVGYTALMGQDEHNALDLVHKNIKIQKPLVEKYHGKWLKEMGDGSMAQFASALDAVNCAMEIQEKVAYDLPEQLRIGIHLGDITIEEDEIYGDGVNVASRIESAAEPGSVYISEAVFGAAKRTDGIKAQYQGERKFKNVSEPVRVYKVISDNISDSRGGSFWKKYLMPAIFIFLIVIVGVGQFTNWFSIPNRKTLLVLPLEFKSVDNSRQYLARSMTNELIGSLGKVSKLNIINPFTTRTFEGAKEPMSKALNQLDEIDCFLKGSMDLNGVLFRINVGLFNREEKEIWSNSYQHDMTLLPELCGLITSDISKVLKIKLNPAEIQRITELKPIDPELYELWENGQSQLNKETDKAYDKAHMYFSEALDKSPANAQTWTGLAEVKLAMAHSNNPPHGIWNEVKATIKQALQLDSMNAEAWAALAQVKTYFDKDYRDAEYAYEKANQLNPSIAGNHFHYSRQLYLQDQIETAIEEAIIAQKLDPLQQEYYGWLSVLYAKNAEFEKSKKELDRITDLLGESHYIYCKTGEVYLEIEQYDSAMYCYEKGGYDIGIALAQFRKGDRQKGKAMLECVLDFPLNSWQAYRRAQIYAEIDSLDRFFEYANYDPPHASVPWLRKTITNPKIIQDPRYTELMNKMNLPMPKAYK